MGRGRKGEEIKGQYEKRKKARTSALRGAYRERADGAVLTHEGMDFDLIRCVKRTLRLHSSHWYYNLNGYIL
jgi:hypothetical protein